MKSNEVWPVGSPRSVFTMTNLEKRGVEMWSASLFHFLLVTVTPLLEVNGRAEEGWEMQAEGRAKEWPVSWSCEMPR